jgi:hypothetical protein
MPGITFSVNPPAAKKTKGSKTPRATKLADHQRMGARTAKEPERVPWRREVETPESYGYRPPGKPPQPDTPELRAKVAQAAIEVEDARYAYLSALKRLELLGALPDSILKDLPFKVKRHLRLYKQSRTLVKVSKDDR